MPNTDMKISKALTKIRLKQTNNILDVHGVSMEPLIFEGDNLLIEEQPSYSIGDIVVVVDLQCRILVHRIIRFQDNIIITKGDNTVGIDESFSENCLGKVTCIYPSGRIDDSVKIHPYRSITDPLILKLSKRMNRKFISGIPGEKLFAGWERKIIICIERVFYRWKR